MQEQLTINFQSKSYTSEPVKVGNFIAVEKLKAMLLDGQSFNIYRSATFEGDATLRMVEIESMLTVFFPKLIEDLKPKSIRDLGLKDYKDFKTLYDEKIKTWFLGHVKMLKGEDDADKKTI